jgi:hypothetical protein
MTALKLEKSSASLIIGKVQITLTTKCQIWLVRLEKALAKPTDYWEDYGNIARELMVQCKIEPAGECNLSLSRSMGKKKIKIVPQGYSHLRKFSYRSQLLWNMTYKQGLFFCSRIIHNSKNSTQFHIQQ